MATALVLSGGGAKGSFEVGALQYLYEKGFFASVICSTSVGSVNAIQLVHGGTPETQKAAFDKLKTIWQTELTYNEDMYDEAAWLRGVSPALRQSIVKLFSGSIDMPRLASDVIFFPPLALGQAVALGIDLVSALNGLRNSNSIFTLDPTRAKINKYLNRDTVAHSGVELRLVAVSLDSGAVRYITQDGRVLETDGTPVVGPNPTVCKAERAAYEASQAAHTAAAHAVQEAATSESPRGNLPEAIAELRRADADLGQARRRLDECMAAAVANGTGDKLVVDVVDGVIASSAIPCAFPPVMLGNESYVDGGVRWVLPLKAAFDFNTDSIIAINASLAGVQPARLPFRQAGILDIAERASLGILLWETQERHVELAKVLALARGRKIWVITPRVDVHDTLTIDPGLIDINIAYGYMCAADVTTAFPFAPETPPAEIPHPDTDQVIGAPGREEGRLGSRVPAPTTPVEGQFIDQPANSQLVLLADTIAKCRRRCWEIEHRVFGASMGEGPFTPRSEIKAVPNPEELDQLRMLKTVLGLLVAARQLSNGSLPGGAATWADNWERHRWVPSDVPGVGDTPWNAFVSRAGDRPAATRPTALVVQAPGQAEVYLLSPLKQWITSPDALFQVLPGIGWAGVQQLDSEYVNAFPRSADINAT